MSDPMRRAWCFTFWRDQNGDRLAPIDENRNGGVIPLDEWLNAIHELSACIAGRYYAWSLETGSADAENEEQTGLHLHAYVEADRSVRWSTVVRRAQILFVGAHVEPRHGWRTTAREYHSGFRRGEMKEDFITGGEWGEWLEIGDGSDMKPDDIAAEAAKMILSGASARDVAMRFPRWFITKGAGVERLYKVVNFAN